MLIDSHCHLFARQFDSDRDACLERAKANGVGTILLPNIDVESLEALNATASAYLGVCLPMLGLHPTSVGEDWEEQLDRIQAALNTTKAYAIGEIGLDYYWGKTFVEAQKEAFRIQIRWAKARNLPIAIHTRDSFEDALAIVQEEQDGTLKGVFHCFTGSLNDARRVQDVGFYMGIGGIITFKNGGLAEVAKDIPLDYLLLETDAPYLAPAPHRGKRNEPAYLRLVADKLAEVKGLSVEEIEEATSRNAERLFGLEV